RWCLNSLPRRGRTPPVLPWNPPQNPTTSALPVAARPSRRAASTASAPPENIWMRVRPSGVTEVSSSRNLARVSVVKLPKVSRSPGRLRGWTETGCGPAPSLTALTISARVRAPGRLRGWPETRCDLAPSLMAPFISQKAGVQEPKRQVGRDARRRLVAVERETRPGVHVQQHGRARGRDDRVPPVHLQAERRGRAAHEAREARLVERVAGQALLLVI